MRLKDEISIQKWFKDWTKSKVELVDRIVECTNGNFPNPLHLFRRKLVETHFWHRIWTQTSKTQVRSCELECVCMCICVNSNKIEGAGRSLPVRRHSLSWEMAFVCLLALHLPLILINHRIKFEPINALELILKLIYPTCLR